METFKFVICVFVLLYLYDFKNISSKIYIIFTAKYKFRIMKNYVERGSSIINLPLTLLVCVTSIYSIPRRSFSSLFLGNSVQIHLNLNLGSITKCNCALRRTQSAIKLFVKLSLHPASFELIHLHWKMFGNQD